MLNRGYEVSVLPNLCCGLPAYAYGDLDSVRWFAEQNAGILAGTDADVIVTDCGSCTSFLKEYDRFTAEHAGFSADKVMDFTTWLDSTVEFARYAGSGVSRVTYHDPCHLAHYLKEREAPRRVLREMPSTDYVELNEADFCCGGAGSYNIAHYDISMKILQRKMRNVTASGADILATACPACLIQLNYGVKKHRLPVKVRHISQLVLERSK
jgi:glycolate oxidase iron-sulfur subunit